MKFVSTNIGDLNFYLLLVQPDWDTPIEVTHQLDTHIDLGRTSLEDRYPLRSAFLLTQTCNLQPYLGDADDWRKGLAALGPERIGMPLWFDAVTTDQWANRIYDPQQVLNFDPNTDAFQIIARASMPSDPTTLPYPYIAPLLIGYWDKRPAADVIQGDMGSIAIAIKEASPYNCRIGLLPSPSGWTASPDYVSPPQDASDFGLQVLESKNSAAREPAVDAILVQNRWSQEGDFAFNSRADIGAALAWFYNQRGSLLSWSGLPAWFQPGAPTSDTPNTYTARFASDSLVMTYIDQDSGSSHIGFIQEIAGRTQSNPALAYLFEIKYLKDPSNPDCFINYDSPVTIGSLTFIPSPVEMKTLRLSLRPQDENVQVSFPYLQGSLIDDWTKGRLYGEVTVTIYKVNPDIPPGALPSPIFSGYITQVIPDGAMQVVTASLMGSMLQRRVPSWVYGSNCNAHVFDDECGLDEASFDASCTIAASDLSSDGMSITARGITGGGATSDWYRNGTLRTGSGRRFIAALIVGSSAVVSGVATITLSRPLYADMIASGGGQSATLVPGCDGQYQNTCINKFGNGANFRGTPFIPPQLQLVTPGQSTKAGK